MAAQSTTRWLDTTAPSILLLISVALLTFRVLLVPEAVVVADEYYYAKTAQLWHQHQQGLRQITSLPGRGEAGLPNYLFFSIYQWTFSFADRFYTVAKLMNVALATLMALAVGRVARNFMTQSGSLWLSILVLWMPATSYYCYFMAEPLYEVLVWWGIALFFTFLSSNRAASFAILGAFLGAAFLAKPNAIALLTGVNAVALALAWFFPHPQGRWRHLLLCLCVLNLAFLATGFGLNRLTTGNWVWDPVGKFYQTGLSKISEVSSSWSFAQATLKYSAIYLLALLLLFSPAWLVLWVRRRHLADEPKSLALAALTLLGLAALTAGSVKVGVNWERAYSNHIGAFSTRYMSVLFPLLIIAFVRWLPDAIPHRQSRRWAGLTLAAAVFCLAVVFRAPSNIFQMRESHWPLLLHPAGFLAGTILLLGLILYFSLAPSPRPQIYGALLALWLLGAAFTYTYTDRREALRGSAATFARIARAANDAIPYSARDHGSIVSTDRRGAVLFMFRFSGFVPLRLLEPNQALVAPADQPSTPWTIYLGTAHPQDATGCRPLSSAILCGVPPPGL